MFQIICFAFAALLTVFTIAEFNKARRYGVLMAGAAIALIGTFLLMGFDIINPSDNKSAYALVIAMIVVFGLAFAASDAKEKEESKKKKDEPSNLDKDKQSLPEAEHFEKPKYTSEKIEKESLKSSDVREIESAPLQTIESVSIPDALATEQALEIFKKAIDRGLIEIQNGHFKWNGSKVLLAYLCGRLYCEDKPAIDEKSGKSIWICGRRDFFPEADIATLFQVEDVGQSRQNRKGAPVPQKSSEIDKLFE